ncbi:6800_t:CDS:2, partial [Funneliformis geosporum]
SLIISGKLILTPRQAQSCELQATKIELVDSSADDYPFQKQNIPLEVGFYYVPTPIITSSDSEGAGELFNIATNDKEPFFSKAATLTVSGQLQAEALAQAEIINLAERMIKYVVNYVVDNNLVELEYLENYDKENKKELVRKLKKIASTDFKKIAYEERMDLNSEHEKYLCQYFDNSPLFVLNYPRDLKAFYMKNNPDGKTVASFDLLFPEIGELIGGSVREDNYQILKEKAQKIGLDFHNLSWYFDLRKFGYAPSAGFGLGLERLLMFLGAAENIRDVIPFPRYPQHLEVGLPNVGKSSLFYLLTKKENVLIANYPFATIDPSQGIMAVPDERLEKLTSGASQGLGLGNEFLSHIREVDLVCHVLRCFTDSIIQHVEETVDPIRDYEIIQSELILADLQQIEKRKQKIQSLLKKQPQLEKELKLLGYLEQNLMSGLEISQPMLTPEQKEVIKGYNLLTLKPFIIIANYNQPYELEVLETYFQKKETGFFSLSVQTESDGIRRPTQNPIELNLLMQKIKQLLNLKIFFTAGPKETRSWLAKQEMNAKQCASLIHSDIGKRFIRAQIYNYKD